MVFEIERIVDHIVQGLAVLGFAQLFEDLFSTFVGQVGAAYHQQVDDRLRQQPTQCQRTRQKDKQLVL